MSPFMQTVEMLYAFCETYLIFLFFMFFFGFFVPTSHVQLIALEMKHVVYSRYPTDL